MAIPNRFLNSTQKNTQNPNTIPLTQIDILYKNRAMYARKIAQDILDKSTAGTIEELNCLSADVLIAAPPNFFDKIQEVALQLTTLIQNNLSNSDKSYLIAQLKEDPTNTDLKLDAFQAINTEYLKYDNSKANVDYNSLDKLEKIFVLAMVFNEICGLGVIEPLYRDERTKEVMCNGPYDIQVDMGSLIRVESCKFKNAQHLQDIINKLYSSVNREITRTNPRDNARLKDKSRLFATHTAICPDGPNLCLRKHPEGWISPSDLLDWGTMSPELAKWLGSHIHSGLSFVVNGGTGSGKTTTLSSLLGFYPNNKRIVTIEKNIELKIPKWKMQAAALECIPKKSDSNVFVTMRDLVECCTQMRPDMIVCGEIIDGAAFDFLQAGNTGHQTCTTIHSNGAEECIERLTSLSSQAGLIVGKETLGLISAAIDFIVTIERLDDGSRKITDVSEVCMEPVSSVNGAKLVVSPIWKFIPNKVSETLGDKITGEWIKVGDLSIERQRKHRLNYKTLPTLSQLMQLTIDPKETLVYSQGGLNESI